MKIIPFEVALKTLPEITSERDLVDLLIRGAEKGYLSFDMDSKTFKLVVSADMNKADHLDFRITRTFFCRQNTGPWIQPLRHSHFILRWMFAFPR